MDVKVKFREGMEWRLRETIKAYDPGAKIISSTEPRILYLKNVTEIPLDEMGRFTSVEKVYSENTQKKMSDIVKAMEAFYKAEEVKGNAYKDGHKFKMRLISNNGPSQDCGLLEGTVNGDRLIFVISSGQKLSTSDVTDYIRRKGDVSLFYSESSFSKVKTAPIVRLEARINTGDEVVLCFYT
jgi:hypothetical protein